MQAEASQSSCNSGKYCLWFATNYAGSPALQSSLNTNTGTNTSYSSYWDHSTLSWTQKKASGAFVACTLPNYGSNNNPRSAAIFYLNDGTTC